ncbi:phosphotransferase, partial [Pseudomonas aeruginosa]|uniref:phosphotransferase n=1 Tax=Pseudomonas aeruginosa TaxID=287 RepID=UPI0022CDF69E
PQDHITLEMAPLEIRHRSVRPISAKHAQASRFLQQSLPNFMVDPKTLQCTGLIDLGRLGTADRYADLALMIANAEENWAAPDEAERAFAVLFNVLGIEAPDRERLAFYLRLDPLTWG